MARPQPQPTKSKAHKTSDELQVERLHKGYAQSMEITKVLADEQSQFQHIRIFDTVANGRVMTLDDIVQITSRDESPMPTCSPICRCWSMARWSAS